MTKDAIQMVFLGALVILSFCSAKVTPTSHDMRMEDFEICRKEWNKKSTKFPLKFSPGGEVLKLSNKSEQSQQSKMARRKSASTYRVLGKWSLSPSGRVTFSTSENGCVERYSAEFQPNPFGDAPRMVKGTIVEDNVRWGFRNLFRRVTASFSAEGFGKDTLDTSYRSRGSL